MKNLFQKLILLTSCLMLLLACRDDDSRNALTYDEDHDTIDTTAFGAYGMKEALTANEIIDDWPAQPKEVATTIIQKYGEPDEVTERLLIWYNNGPWKKTIVSKEEVPHDFPMPHTDIVEQFIDYKVPADKFDDLAEYDGSVIVERTKGVISARCDKEEMNFLALNLAHDVITGKKSVEQARDFYAKTVKAFKNGDKDPYTQAFQFSIPSGDTGYKDEPAKM